MENKKDCLRVSICAMQQAIEQNASDGNLLPTLLLPSINATSHIPVSARTHTILHIIITDPTRIRQKSKAEMTDSTNSTRARLKSSSFIPHCTTHHHFLSFSYTFKDQSSLLQNYSCAPKKGKKTRYPTSAKKRKITCQHLHQTSTPKLLQL